MGSYGVIVLTPSRIGKSAGTGQETGESGGGLNAAHGENGARYSTRQ